MSIPQALADAFAEEVILTARQEALRVAPGASGGVTIDQVNEEDKNTVEMIRATMEKNRVEAEAAARVAAAKPSA